MTSTPDLPAPFGSGVYLGLVESIALDAALEDLRARLPFRGLTETEIRDRLRRHRRLVRWVYLELAYT
jgi:hypothetical protein